MSSKEKQKSTKKDSPLGKSKKGSLTKKTGKKEEMRKSPERKKSVKKSSVKTNSNSVKLEDESKRLRELNEDINEMIKVPSEEKLNTPVSKHFAQEASFSSVNENGKTTNFKSVKGSFKLSKPEETEKICSSMAENNPNIKCSYDKENNVCYLDMTQMADGIVDLLGLGNKLKEDTHEIKNYLNKRLSPQVIHPSMELFKSHHNSPTMKPSLKTLLEGHHNSPLGLSELNGEHLRKPLFHSSMSPTQPILILRTSAPMTGGDPCSIGNKNSCDGGRLIYDAQGQIDCGNMSNQGGQRFMYPKKITNFVGGKKKKSLKKRKQSGGYCGQCSGKSVF